MRTLLDKKNQYFTLKNDAARVRFDFMDRLDHPGGTEDPWEINLTRFEWKVKDVGYRAKDMFFGVWKPPSKQDAMLCNTPDSYEHSFKTGPGWLV